MRPEALVWQLSESLNLGAVKEAQRKSALERVEVEWRGSLVSLHSLIHCGIFRVTSRLLKLVWMRLLLLTQCSNPPESWCPISDEQIAAKGSVSPAPLLSVFSDHTRMAANPTLSRNPRRPLCGVEKRPAQRVSHDACVSFQNKQHLKHLLSRHEQWNPFFL